MMKSNFDGMKKLMSHFGVKFESLAAKPDPTPIEPQTTSGGTKMEMSPEMAAKFAAQDNANAELKARLDAVDNEKKAKVLVEKADAALSRKVVTLALKDQIGKFASDAVSKKDGEAWFDKFVESLKPSLRDKPPSSVAEFSAASGQATDPTDPIFSKFQGEAPDALERIAKFSVDYRRLKQDTGDRMTCPEEDYIKNELALWKSQRNGEILSGTGR